MTHRVCSAGTPPGSLLQPKIIEIKMRHQGKGDCFLIVLGLRSPNQSRWFVMNSISRGLWNVATILADNKLFLCQYSKTKDERSSRYCSLSLTFACHSLSISAKIQKGNFGEIRKYCKLIFLRKYNISSVCTHHSSPCRRLYCWFFSPISI